MGSGWWWWCAAVVHVRVDAGVEGVGGAGGVWAVGAFGGGLLHCGCGWFVFWGNLFGCQVSSSPVVGVVLLVMMSHLLSSGAGGASLCGSAVDVIGSSGGGSAQLASPQPSLASDVDAC